MSSMPSGSVSDIISDNICYDFVVVVSLIGATYHKRTINYTEGKLKKKCPNDWNVDKYVFLYAVGACGSTQQCVFQRERMMLSSFFSKTD